MYTIKENDTAPDLTAQLLEADLTPIDLTTASSVSFIMRDSTLVSGTPKVKATCDITDAANGRVSYLWKPTDTDTAGTFNVEFEILWGTDIQTVPNDSYVQIKIVADLG